MPSHSSSTGTQASEGIARSAWKLGSSSASMRRLRPIAAPTASASPAPAAKPAATRSVLAPTWRIRRARPIRSSVAKISLGAGTR